ncbi:MAG TPA: NUDIX domain-containing protein, partial [Saprospiraceae bacterium]|nr:NUDIX domain-containing protein [Saprospiraceae bacterium]
MYKIYINEIPFILKSSSDISQDDLNTEGVIVARYTGKTKHILNFVDLCEKGGKINGVTLYHDDLVKLKTDFKSLFTTIEAAGGIVVNEFDEILFIFRRGFWDLPKGKIDMGESKKQAAVREVEEETGIKELSLIKKIGITRHTFKIKPGSRVLKKSYWYLMTTKKQKLKPQKSEDIVKAEWIDLNTFYKICSPVYKNIAQILSDYEAASEVVDVANLHE